jgi:hypothetical protein
MSRVAVRAQVLETAGKLPLGSKIGFGIMVIGIVADLVAHLDPALDQVHGGAVGPELSAHLVVFAGMALVLIGVVVDGVRSGGSSGRTDQGR